LSKPLILLEIPQLKGVLEKCGRIQTGCCKAKEALAISAESKAFEIVNSLKEGEVKKLRKALIEDSKAEGVNIVFGRINKNIII